MNLFGVIKWLILILDEKIDKTIKDLIWSKDKFKENHLVKSLTAKVPASESATIPANMNLFFLYHFLYSWFC